MRRSAPVLVIVLGLLPGLHIGLAGLALAQVAGAGGGALPQPLLIRLVKPVYPLLARGAGITGDVTIEILIRSDGTVGAAEVMSGHERVPREEQLYRDSSAPRDMDMYPLLRQAALDSARHLQFRCEGCGDAGRSFVVTYAFTIFPEKFDPCCCTSKEGESGIPRENSTSFASTDRDKFKMSDMVISVREKQACMCPDRCPSTMRYIQEHARFRTAKCLYLWKCGRRTSTSY